MLFLFIVLCFLSISSTMADHHLEPCDANDTNYWAENVATLKFEGVINIPKDDIKFTVSIADIHSASVYIADNTIYVEVYWNYLKNISVFTVPRYTGAVPDEFSDEDLYDVTADLADVDVVVFCLAFFKGIMYFGIKAPVNGEQALSDYLFNQIVDIPTCVDLGYDHFQHNILLDLKCLYPLSVGSPVTERQCLLTTIFCGTLNIFFILNIEDPNNILFGNSIGGLNLNSNLDIHDALSLQSGFTFLPQSNVSILIARGVLEPYTNPLHRNDWYYLEISYDALISNNAVVVLFDKVFPRSALAAPDSGNIIVETYLNSPLGTNRYFLLLPSATRGSYVEFIDPHMVAPIEQYDTGASSYIYHLSAAYTDYNYRNLKALFAASFWYPETRLYVGTISSQPAPGWLRSELRGSFYSSFSGNFEMPPYTSSYNKHIGRFSLGTEYEYINNTDGTMCTKINPFLSAIYADLDYWEIMRVMMEPFVLQAPTNRPSPSPVSNIDPYAEIPLRLRGIENEYGGEDQISMPISVITTDLLHVRCENNTWVRPETDTHCDSCSPAETPLTRSLWYAFETSALPAVYMIYTDPAKPMCQKRECNAGVPYVSSPLQSTTISLWNTCTVGEHGDEECSSTRNNDDERLAEEHALLGPLCFPPSTMHHVRVRNSNDTHMGDFDLTIEEWVLRRGGDQCHTARPITNIKKGEINKQNEVCNAAVYTNLCASNSTTHDLTTQCYFHNLQDMPTTWFKFETSSSTDISSVSFTITFNDEMSHAWLPVESLYEPFDPQQNMRYFISVWTSCDILNENPLVCKYGSDVDEHPHAAVITINNTVAQPIFPSTTYYVAVSTTYRGDFAICGVEDSELPCRSRGIPGPCFAVCSLFPQEETQIESLDSRLIVQNFSGEGFAAGKMGSEFTDLMPGVDITAFGRSCRCCLRPMLFDTEKPTGDDCELGTPNTRFSNGPGCGLGGSEGRGVNFRKLGLALIVSEDDDKNDPDAMRFPHVILRFDFCAPVIMEYIVFINARHGTKVTLFDDNLNDYPEFPVEDRGANGIHNLTLNDRRYAPKSIKRMDVELSGTGDHGTAIAEFAYRMPGLNGLCDGDPNAPYIERPTEITGACCHKGGKECMEQVTIEQCDAVLGDFSKGETCYACPHASSIFGWQEDPKKLLENDRHLRRKTVKNTVDFGYTSSSSSSSDSSSSSSEKK